MSCSYCANKIAGMIRGSTGVPTSGAADFRERCPYCGAFLTAEGVCNNPKCSAAAEGDGINAEIVAEGVVGRLAERLDGCGEDIAVFYIKGNVGSVLEIRCGGETVASLDSVAGLGWVLDHVVDEDEAEVVDAIHDLVARLVKRGRARWSGPFDHDIAYYQEYVGVPGRLHAPTGEPRSGQGDPYAPAIALMQKIERRIASGGEVDDLVEELIRVLGSDALPYLEDGWANVPETPVALFDLYDILNILAGARLCETDERAWERKVAEMEESGEPLLEFWARLARQEKRGASETS